MAHKILDELNEVLIRFGFPEQPISDNASYFTAKAFRDTCSILEIRHHKTTPYYPQLSITECVIPLSAGRAAWSFSSLLVFVLQ